MTLTARVLDLKHVAVGSGPGSPLGRYTPWNYRSGWHGPFGKTMKDHMVQRSIEVVFTPLPMIFVGGKTVSHQT